MHEIEIDTCFLHLSTDPSSLSEPAITFFVIERPAPKPPRGAPRANPTITIVTDSMPVMALLVGWKETGCSNLLIIMGWTLGSRKWFRPSV
ncbi:hypothetical protein Clacol_002316 [Clathrus columnatus]|uniref:Uncharacterized protein n=1 Tax=Clathrus columnatus TaxID=1419009 RepID=A0AAV5A4I2_9AGAM|nr:hypothetical protein Clacol_002316 [Clathrus columnatus]